MGSRRSLLKGALGLWSGALVAASSGHPSEAARRGYGGPGSPDSSGGGYSFQIHSNREDVLSCVTLAGLGPTDFSVRVSNRTPDTLKLEVYQLGVLTHSLLIIENQTWYNEFSDAGIVQFRASRADGPVLLIWEAKLPASF
jgi:hypothetical protein